MLLCLKEALKVHYVVYEKIIQNIYNYYDLFIIIFIIIFITITDYFIMYI